MYLDAVHERKRLQSAERRESKRVEGIDEQKRKDDPWLLFLESQYLAKRIGVPYLFLYATLIYSNTLLVPSHRWHPKRSSPWPWVAKKIAAEIVNVDLRTTARIEALYADAGRSSELVFKKWHSCLNIFCFFLTVLCMFILYCHWLLVYLKSTVIVN